MPDSKIVAAYWAESESLKIETGKEYDEEGTADVESASGLWKYLKEARCSNSCVWCNNKQ